MFFPSSKNHHYDQINYGTNSYQISNDIAEPSKHLLKYTYPSYQNDFSYISTNHNWREKIRLNKVTLHLNEKILSRKNFIQKSLYIICISYLQTFFSIFRSQQLKAHFIAHLFNHFRIQTSSFMSVEQFINLLPHMIGYLVTILPLISIILIGKAQIPLQL